MTDTERIAALEAEVADLKRHLQRCEAEHISLLNSYQALAADRETQRRDMEQDYTLLGQAIDERITGLAKRIGSIGGGETAEALAETLREFAQDMAQFVNRALEQQELRILNRVMDRFDKILDLIEARA